MFPKIIQGGMGVAVSNWKLARAVSRRGQLGVISGTALDTVFVRRLQDGDPQGDMRRAMVAFPIDGVAERVLERYFLPNGREPGKPYRLLPMYRQHVSSERQLVTVLANMAIKTNDEQLKKVLAESGINLGPAQAPAPTQTPAPAKK